MRNTKLVIEIKDGGIIYTAANDDMDIVIIHHDTGKVSDVVHPDDIGRLSEIYRDEKFHDELSERGFLGARKVREPHPKGGKQLLKTKFTYLDQRGNADIMTAYSTRLRQNRFSLALDFANDGKGGFYSVHLEITGVEPYSRHDFEASKEGLEKAIGMFNDGLKKYKEEYGLVVNLDRSKDEFRRLELIAAK